MTSTTWKFFDSDETENFDFKHFSDSMTNNLLYFIARLYNYNDISRSRVQDIIKDLNGIFNTSLMKSLFCSLVKKLKALNDSEESITYFSKVFHTLYNPFENLSNEY